MPFMEVNEKMIGIKIILHIIAQHLFSLGFLKFIFADKLQDFKVIVLPLPLTDQIQVGSLVILVQNIHIASSQKKLTASNKKTCITIFIYLFIYL